MSSFRKIDRKPLPERIAAEIEEAILTGRFAVGALLPSEQQLANQFGVSRNVVREAFKFLKERGLIDIQNGAGATVIAPSSHPASSALGRYLRMNSPQDAVAALYEIRRLLEGETARLAAQRADAEDIGRLDACLQRMVDHTGDIEAWSDADLDFHLAIAAAAHNPLFSMLLQPLVAQLRDVIREGYAETGAVERGLEAHRTINDCIKRGDSDGAYQAILDHLRDSEQRVERLNASRSAQVQAGQKSLSLEKE